MPVAIRPILCLDYTMAAAGVTENVDHTAVSHPQQQCIHPLGFVAGRDRQLQEISHANKKIAKPLAG